MKDRTQAAVFTTPGQPLEQREIPLRHPAAGEVLVRITCCTLCGSDLHTYQGHRPTPTPTILGHEILGVITALGPGDPPKDYAGNPLIEGTRVTWSIAASCGRCFFCLHDLPQKCEHLFKYGHEKAVDPHPLSGGLAEHCLLAPGTTILPVPEVLPDRVACPVNCATATVAAALRTAGSCRDEVVLVQGVGMLGLTACAMAHAAGAKAVVACDTDPQRLERAREFGATECVDIRSDPETLAATVKALTGGRGCDLALELSGNPAAIESGLPLLRIGGRYRLVGSVFPSRPVALSPEQIVRRWLNIQGVHNYAPADLQSALDFLAQHHDRFPFESLVSRTFPLSQAEPAFQEAIASRAFRVAVGSGQ